MVLDCDLRPWYLERGTRRDFDLERFGEVLLEPGAECLPVGVMARVGVIARGGSSIPPRGEFPSETVPLVFADLRNPKPSFGMRVFTFSMAGTHLQ